MTLCNLTLNIDLYCRQDEALADGKVVIDLIDAIKPGAINYDNVLPGGNEEVSARRRIIWAKTLSTKEISPLSNFIIK